MPPQVQDTISAISDGVIIRKQGDPIDFFPNSVIDTGGPDGIFVELQITGNRRENVQVKFDLPTEFTDGKGNTISNIQYKIFYIFNAAQKRILVEFDPHKGTIPINDTGKTLIRIGISTAPGSTIPLALPDGNYICQNLKCTLMGPA